MKHGYYGYHETFQGEKVYLRSAKEYLVALYLDTKKIPYVVEPYGLFDHCRPDFLLPTHNLIIEVKDTNQRRIKVIQERRTLYNSHGYRMIAIGRVRHFSKIMRIVPNSEELLSKWKDMPRAIDSKGVNNPRYGTKCSDETRRRISEKAKIRCRADSFRKAASERMLAFYASEAGAVVRESMKGVRVEREDRPCVICGKTFVVKKTKKKQVCSPTCSGQRYSLRVKSGEIVLPKQTREDGLVGTIARTLKQWVTRAGLTIDDIETDEAFSQFLKTKQEEGVISKRTCLTSPDRFFHMFGGKEQFLAHLEEYNSYDKDN